MQGRLLTFLVAAVLTLCAAPTRAATMDHYDLTSLALQAEAIVVARRIGQRPLGPYDTAVAHRVEAVLAGPLQPGDIVEVSYGALSFELPGRSRLAPDAGPPVVSDEVILFLEPAGRGRSLPPDAGAPLPWWLVPSGLRIFADGLAYRFEQRGNPGPYQPEPQRNEWRPLVRPRTTTTPP
jgi:hypothetical protein